MTPSTERPPYVLDASVAVKWYLRDKQDVGPADAVLADYRDDRIQLIAPEQIRYEVPSAVRNALRTNRLAVDQVRRAVATFLAWRIPTVGDDDLILAAFDHAVQFGCSLYDGLYMALADAIQGPLIYADQRLRNALRGQSPQAVWLPDYVRQT